MSVPHMPLPHMPLTVDEADMATHTVIQRLQYRQGSCVLQTVDQRGRHAAYLYSFCAYPDAPHADETCLAQLRVLPRLPTRAS